MRGGLAGALETEECECQFKRLGLPETFMCEMLGVEKGKVGEGTDSDGLGGNEKANMPLWERCCSSSYTDI